VAVDSEGRAWQEAEPDAGWLRPVERAGRREPRWGHPDGLQIGLHPLSGPRGLIRIYTPYLDQPRDRLVNFIAVEPIPAGSTERGYSELERSRLDDASGLRLWSADDPEDATPRSPDAPSRGIVTTEDGVGVLTVHILMESFANGADVWITARFRAGRPHEVTLAAWRREGSDDLEACILTATMGNWARLRQLHLADGTVTAGELWPDYRDIHFADHAVFPVERFTSDAEGVWVSATPDEASPDTAVHAEGTAEHWRYIGRRGVQTWRAADPDERLVAQVNGRHTYWMSDHAIPGGIAFENFELVEPFRPGRAFTFSVTPLDGDTADDRHHL